MAAADIQSSSVTSTNIGGTLVSTIVVNKPSGVVDGDLMVAFIHTQFNSSAQSLTAPAGWTLVRTTESSPGSAGSCIKSYYKIASSEGSDYTWTYVTALGAYCGGSILRITDHNASTPVLTSNGASGGTGTSISSACTVTPTNGNQLILMAFYGRVVSSTTTVSSYAVATSNPSWTELYDVSSSGTGGSMALAYAARPEDTATGNATLTTSTSISTDSVIQMVVIDRIYSFSSTISDSTTVSDTVTNNVGFNLTVAETVTPTDTITAEKQKTWATQNKSSNTWTNEDKS
jgi:hypothetical protein